MIVSFHFVCWVIWCVGVCPDCTPAGHVFTHDFFQKRDRPSLSQSAQPFSFSESKLKTETSSFELKSRLTENILSVQYVFVIYTNVSALPVFVLFFAGISTLIAKGVYDAAFPLHDVSVWFKAPMIQQFILMCYPLIQLSWSGHSVGCVCILSWVFSLCPLWPIRPFSMHLKLLNKRQ